jgi:citrate lyase subunit beta/citryl-CoA lyase/(S)-citramalyl-CoA lyase
MDERHLRRTWIITPATAPARFADARSAGANVAMVDLEDSVAFTDKERARHLASRFFEPPARPDPGAGRVPGPGMSPPTQELPLGIRINALATPDGARDLLELAGYPHKPQIILVPKVESGRDIDLVAALVDTSLYAPELYALIETPLAIENISSIARAARLAGVVFGAADFAAQARCRLGWQELLYPRSALVTSATARDLPAVDSPFFDLNDLTGLAEESERARALGYCGKGAVHPRQVPVIARSFRPTEEEVAAARTILAAAAGSGGSITSVNSAMVGRPFFRAAETVAAQAAGAPTSTTSSPSATNLTLAETPMPREH